MSKKSRIFLEKFLLIIIFTISILTFIDYSKKLIQYKELAPGKSFEENIAVRRIN